jgi:cbb3-type cytochrome oxidase subunit 3
MRAIAEPFFERSPLLLGPVFTLLLFFVVFLGVVFYVLRSKSLRFEALSNLPLSDGRSDSTNDPNDASGRTQEC